MAFGPNSTVRELMENEEARAVFERHIPGISQHPQLSQAWYMTLREVSYYPESGMSRAMFDAIIADLANIDA